MLITKRNKTISTLKAFYEGYKVERVSEFNECSNCELIEDLRVCYDCNSFCCKECLSSCDRCSSVVSCNNCHHRCEVCRRLVCNRCSLFKCFNCKDLVCFDCLDLGLGGWKTKVCCDNCIIVVD